MRIFILTICLAFWGISAVAQKYEVSGSIVESDTREVLPQVNIQLLSNDSVLVASTNTNDKGEFLLSAQKAGQYIVCAKIMGFTPLVRNVQLSKQKPLLKLGILKMIPITTDMDELNVSALARMMTMKKDTLLFYCCPVKLKTA